jgi:D-amino peptidase
MKVYIMYEVGGAMGIVSTSQMHGMFPAQRAAGATIPLETRQAVTAEVNAAIEGAAQAGASEFLINTGCPNGRFVLPNELDERADLIQGSWKPDGTMEGLDESFDAAILLSMHAKRGCACAVFAHSWSEDIVDYRVNGVSVGEVGMAIYFAGALGVPVVMVSGDAHACDEARQLLGEIEIAPTKYGISRAAARSPHPSKVLRSIHDAAQRAIARLDSFRPAHLSTPVTVEMDTLDGRLIPWWLSIPTVEANGSTGVKWQAPDYQAAHRLFTVMDMLHAGYSALEEW